MSNQKLNWFKEKGQHIIQTLKVVVKNKHLTES